MAATLTGFFFACPKLHFIFLLLNHLGVNPKIGGKSPQIIHFNGVLYYKPSILGYPPIFGNIHMIFCWCKPLLQNYLDTFIPHFLEANLRHSGVTKKKKRTVGHCAELSNIQGRKRSPQFLGGGFVEIFFRSSPWKPGKSSQLTSLFFRKNGLWKTTN